MPTPLVNMAGRLAADEPDRVLLARFVRDRDEAAFAALVHRHGPTVLGVCRRALGNPADADDAFQAVFLVLVSRADAVAHRVALGGWLHEVAVRVALKARTALARLRKHERRAAGVRGEAACDPPPADPPKWLDRELAALPDRLREPVVRCLVQGRPRADVAAELGIPEGTLASRLDAARKRLARRLPAAALGGLTVTVPPSLTAATVARAADRPGAAIHQLANEVTRAMALNAKWAAATAVGVLAAVGGVLLASGDRPVVRPAVATRTAPPPKTEPAAEPEWMRRFARTYRLRDDQFVKRVAPPYLPERVDFKLNGLSGGKKYAPEVEGRNRKQAEEDAMFYTLFAEQDGPHVRFRYSISSTFLRDRPDLRTGDNLLTLEEAVGCVTGLSTPEFVTDPKAKGHPLLGKDSRVVHGDFVTRKDAPLEKLVPQLEAILRDELKHDVRLTLREEEQPVFVVGGTWKPNPPEWRPKKELDVYATEEGLNKRYNHFDSTTWTVPGARDVSSARYTGSPVDLVRFVGNRLGTRMVWDAPLPAEKVVWINHALKNPTKDEEAADRDPDKMLKVVAGQTGLTFKKERRTVKVLYLSAGDGK